MAQGKGIPTLESKIFASGIQSPGIWNPEYNSKNPEYHKPLESRIQVPLTKTGIQYLESGIQDSLGFLVRMAVTHIS